jgi:hypothetical protein
MTQSLEDNLERLITDYFVWPQTSKGSFMERLLVNTMNPRTKTETLRKICRRQKVDPEIVKEVVREIDEVRRIRNQLAHEDASYNPETKELRVQKMIDRWNINDSILVDEKLVDEMQGKCLRAIQGINRIHLLIVGKEMPEVSLDEPYVE